MLIAGAFGVGAGYSLFLITSGLFVTPMQNEFGWSRSTASIGPVVGLLTVIFFPVAALLIDRYGPRIVAIAGLSFLALAYVLLAHMSVSLLRYWSVIVFMSGICAISTPIVFAKNVTNWFGNNVGTAVGLTMSGISLVGAIVVPLVSAVIDNYGWRAGYYSLAVFVCFFGLVPVLIGFREHPNDVLQREAVPDFSHFHSLKIVARDSRFWRLLIVFVIAAVPVGGFLSHLQPILVSLDITTTFAAAMVSVYALSIGIGRVGSGYLLDRLPPTAVVATFFALSAVGASMLASGGAISDTQLPLIVMVALIGMAQGAETDFLAFFTFKLFEPINFSMVFSVYAMVVGIGMATGGLVFSVIYDLYDSYLFALYLAVVCLLIASVLVLTIRMKRE